MTTSSDDDLAGWAITPPAFQPDAALVTLRRSLRELGLSERGGAFEWHGRRVLEIDVEPQALTCRLARRATVRTPDWDRLTVRLGADQRKLLDEVKRRLARWSDDD
jgi:hypothetical protein